MPRICPHPKSFSQREKDFESSSPSALREKGPVDEGLLDMAQPSNLCIHKLVLGGARVSLS